MQGVGADLSLLPKIPAEARCGPRQRRERADGLVCCWQNRAAPDAQHLLDRDANAPEENLPCFFIAAVDIPRPSTNCLTKGNHLVGQISPGFGPMVFRVVGKFHQHWVDPAEYIAHGVTVLMQPGKRSVGLVRRARRARIRSTCLWFEEIMFNHNNGLSQIAKERHSRCQPMQVNSCAFQKPCDACFPQQFGGLWPHNAAGHKNMWTTAPSTPPRKSFKVAPASAACSTTHRGVMARPREKSKDFSALCVTSSLARELDLGSLDALNRQFTQWVEGAIQRPGSIPSSTA